MRKVIVALVLAGLLVIPAGSGGKHAGDPHWSRTAKNVWLKVHDALPRRHKLLQKVLDRWSQKTPFKFVRVVEPSEVCDIPDRGIRVCAGGGSFASPMMDDDGHIYAGRAVIDGSELHSKMASRYLLCHEIGHALGLDHRPGLSCMRKPWGYPWPTTPDGHDRKMLRTLHEHSH